ncbi:hypothetical protein DM02DRAFT_649519 [Periconia macrospinosa]|uniref:Rhodopsin domain-containing protein n=1 Tax=Periconia macrospinosa TaxID=97972 RepID=A0A2V1E8E3_9PLEO|nr:hypothetical protein DM02DRAFT_649519 [Periconia macrospinosa]
MLDLSDGGRRKFALYVTGAILTTTAVALRIFCKSRSKNGIRYDDYWIIAALLSYLIVCGVMIWGMMAVGGGYEMKEIIVLADKDSIKAEKLEDYLKSLLWSLAAVIFLLYAIKISILLFYRHIFFATTTFRVGSMIIMVIASLTFAATLAPIPVACQPLDSFWNRKIHGKCFNFNIYMLSVRIIDTLLDFAILLLPIHITLQLRLPKHIRIGVAGVFGVGVFSVMTNALCVYYMYQPGEVDVNLSLSEQWLHIHMITCIWCACLPSYKSLFATASIPAGDSSPQTMNIHQDMPSGDSTVGMDQAESPQTVTDTISLSFSNHSSPTKEHGILCVFYRREDDIERFHAYA